AVLVSLGRAQLAASRDAEARATLESAAALARTLGSAELMAQAALGVSMEFTAGEGGEREGRLPEAALEAGRGGGRPRGGAGRAGRGGRRARPGCAGARVCPPGPPRGVARSGGAAGVARRRGDAPTLAAVLFDRHVAIWGGANAEERLAIAGEVVQLANRCGD